MSSVGLNELVGRAAINDSFREGLLNGRRAEVLQRLKAPLDATEHRAVMAIQATEMVEFSIAIEHLIAQGEGRGAGRPIEPAVVQPVGWPTRAVSGAFILHE
jgi:hypothetical protein